MNTPQTAEQMTAALKASIKTPTLPPELKLLLDIEKQLRADYSLLSSLRELVRGMGRGSMRGTKLHETIQAIGPLLDRVTAAQLTAATKKRGRK
jgi:hypothetical protein